MPPWPQGQAAPAIPCPVQCGPTVRVTPTLQAFAAAAPPHFGLQGNLCKLPHPNLFDSARKLAYQHKLDVAKMGRRDVSINRLVAVIDSPEDEIAELWSMLPVQGRGSWEKAEDGREERRQQLADARQLLHDAAKPDLFKLLAEALALERLPVDHVCFDYLTAMRQCLLNEDSSGNRFSDRLKTLFAAVRSCSSGASALR